MSDESCVLWDGCSELKNRFFVILPRLVELLTLNKNPNLIDKPYAVISQQIGTGSFTHEGTFKRQAHLRELQNCPPQRRAPRDLQSQSAAQAAARMSWLSGEWLNGEMVFQVGVSHLTT